MSKGKDQALKACVAFAVDYLSDQNHEVAERDSWCVMCGALAVAGFDVFKMADKKVAKLDAARKEKP